MLCTSLVHPGAHPGAHHGAQVGASYLAIQCTKCDYRIHTPVEGHVKPRGTGGAHAASVASLAGVVALANPVWVAVEHFERPVQLSIPGAMQMAHTWGYLQGG